MFIRRAPFLFTALFCGLLVSGCVTPVDPGAPRAAPTTGAVPDASPAARATSVTSATPAAAANAATPAASPSPVVAATMDVSPPQVAVGPVLVSLAFEPPRHMIDQVALNAADPAQQAVAADTPAGSSEGAVVFSDMVRVTNNLDPSQAVPADTAQSILRHVVLDVRSRDGSQIVPYLGVSLDMLLDGRPVGFGQAVVPMAAMADNAHLYYGNNVRLAQRGTYQVFVRLTRTVLLGKDQPQAAQFNVVVR